MCKNTFAGEPFWKNGAGTFCEPCRKEMKRRAVEGFVTRNHEKDGICKYCGEKTTERPGTDTCMVCDVCSKNMYWVLKCIRFSDRLYRHVVSREEREKNERVKKKQSEQNNRIAPSDERISRLEGMMEQLLEQFTKPK
jgi:hypothetical protein